MVTVVVAPTMPDASKKALTDVSDVVCCSKDIDETTEHVRAALCSAMRKTARVTVQNNDEKEFLHVM
jgi:hypothetical protein